MTTNAVTVTITGNLAETPEIRFTPSGKAVTDFMVIGNDRRYDRAAGTWVNARTTRIRVTCWEKLAEQLTETLHRGDRVTVTGGRLDAEAYISSDGDARAVLAMTARTVTLAPLTAAGDAEPAPDSAAAAAQSAS